MKQGWEIKIFEDCIVKVRSTTKIPKKKFLNDGAYPIISQEDEFINGYWDNEDDIFTVEKPLVIFGDHTKKVKYVDFNFVMGADGIKVLQPIDDINARFFFYQIQSLTIEDLGYARHFRLLKKQYLFIPLLEEQKRIVAKLDKCFEAIDKARTNVQKNLQNAKELFQSQLNQIFSQKGDGWVEKRWGDLCQFVRGPFGGSLKKSMFKESGYIVYEQKHAIHDHFNQLRYFIDEEKFNEMKRFEVKPGDLIMSCSGVTLGKVAIIPEEIQKGIINQALLKLTPYDNILAKFIKYWIRSKIFQDIIFKYSGGAAIPNVPSAKILKGIMISIPNINIQKDVIRDIELFESQTQTLESNYQQELDALDELKKSILQKAFNGEL
jgi:type I restriction enzyme, S subunit